MVDKYLNKIVKWDTYELMKTIPTGSIDLIVTDPPYEFLNATRGGKWGWVCSWKLYIEELYGSMEKNFANWITEEFLDECNRVCKKFHAYFFCNKNQIAQYINFATKHNLLYDVLVWHKTNPIPTCNNKYLSDLEYIIIIRARWTGLNTTYVTASKLFQSTIKKREFDHPTIKPQFILERLIWNSSKEGDIILDPFIGSGSTWVASIKLKRNFIGLELEDKYCKLASERTGCEIIEPTETEKLDEAISVVVEEWIMEIKEVTISVCPTCWGRLVKTKQGKTCEDCMEDYK